jgi:hypothetical protein
VEVHVTDLVEWLETAIGAVEEHERTDLRVSRFNREQPCPACGRFPIDALAVTLLRDKVTLTCGCEFGGDQVAQLWVSSPNPNRAVLRRCAADRKILAKCVAWIDDGSGITSGAALGKIVLRALAEGYGYQEVADHG